MVRLAGLFRRGSRCEDAGSEASPDSSVDSDAAAPQIDSAHTAERPGGRKRHDLAVLVGAFTIGIVALAFADLHSRYLSAIADAKRSAGNSADVLAEHTARTFEALDLIMDSAELVRTDFIVGRYPIPVANRALRLLRRSAPSIIEIGWTNAAGDLVAHSHNGDPPQRNIAELPYFAAQRDGNGDKFLVARPFRSVATGRWITAI